MILLGVWSRHATYERSIVAADVESLINTGKVHIHRTRHWRIPPGEPRFTLKELYLQLDAMEAGKNSCQITNEEFTQGIFELGSGNSSIRWMTQFSESSAEDTEFGEPAGDELELDPSIEAVEDPDLINIADAEATGTELAESVEGGTGTELAEPVEEGHEDNIIATDKELTEVEKEAIKQFGIR